MSSRRIALVGTTPGAGKTTFARELAARLGIEHIELDAWVHGPNWTEAPDEELRARVLPALAGDGWLIDGVYEHKLGSLILDAAELVIWLDPPVVVWGSRLLRRTVRRVVLHETLWNDNRETLRGVFGGREALLPWAAAVFVRRRRDWPLKLAAYPTVRLRSRDEVRAFLDRFAPAGE